MRPVEANIGEMGFWAWLTRDRRPEKLIEAIQSDDEETMLRLLKKDPSLANKPDMYGNLPLHSAVCLNRTRIVRILLEEYGADPNKTSRTMDRALFYNARSEADNDEIALLLLQHNADIHAVSRNGYGEQAVHVASARSNCRILQVYADWDKSVVHAEDDRGWRPVHYASLYAEEASRSVHKSEEDRKLPTTVALDMLLTNGAADDIDVPAKDGSRPAHMASAGCSFDTLLSFKAKGVRFDQRNDNGELPKDVIGMACGRPDKAFSTSLFFMGLHIEEHPEILDRLSQERMSGNAGRSQRGKDWQARLLPPGSSEEHRGRE